MIRLSINRKLQHITHLTSVGLRLGNHTFQSQYDQRSAWGVQMAFGDNNRDGMIARWRRWAVSTRTCRLFTASNNLRQRRRRLSVTDTLRWSPD